MKKQESRTNKTIKMEYKKEYLDEEYVKKILEDCEKRVGNMFTIGGIDRIFLPEAEKAVTILEKIKKRNYEDFKRKIIEIKNKLEASRKKLNSIINLDDEIVTNERMFAYILSMADEKYIGFGKEDVNSIERVGDFKFYVFPRDLGRESRVIVYDVITKNNARAFGTIGGLMWPEDLTTEHLFDKNFKFYETAENVAKMHLYKDAEMYDTKLHKKGIGTKKLAKILDIPDYLL